jgi:transposase-like protein
VKLQQGSKESELQGQRDFDCALIFQTRQTNRDGEVHGCFIGQGRKARVQIPKDRERRFLPEFSGALTWRREVSLA